MTQRSADPQRVIRYAVYHKSTGRIVHVHSQSRAADRQYVEIPIQEMRTMLSTSLAPILKHYNLEPDDLDVIKVELKGSGVGLGEMMVDPQQQQLARRPSLALSAKKRELVGDGQDSTQIEIKLVDARGHAIKGAGGTVKVTTDQGKLSARAGLVDLVNGRASITLTSANETVPRVRVRVTRIDSVFAPAHLDLEFV